MFTGALQPDNYIGKIISTQKQTVTRSRLQMTESVFPVYFFGIKIEQIRSNLTLVMNEVNTKLKLFFYKVLSQTHIQEYRSVDLI